MNMDFSRKFRLVANRAITEAPLRLNYSSVITRDSVCLAFLISGINESDIMACEVRNKYFNAPC